MDKLEVYRTLDTFMSEGQLMEVRAISSVKKGDVWSGYFKDKDTLWNAIQKFDKDYNIYFILNVINDVCYSMLQHDKMVYKADTTKDSDIIARNWVLIDLDTERGGKTVSSTDEEWQKARMKAHEVRNYLRDMGFYYPVVCHSGNGIHLDYKIDSWANTPENTTLIERFLKALSVLFSDDDVKIDTVVSNAARVDKLYGTYARKGTNTSTRPHRMSKILVVPNELKCTPKENFLKVANILPEDNIKHDYHTMRTYDKFNIDEFLTKHNIEVSKDVTTAGVRKIVLKECPFNPDHKAPDSALFVMPNGAIGFSCFHQSCSQYTFRDFRMKFEPDAYDKVDYREFQFKQRQKPVFHPIVESKDKGSVWLQMGQIEKPKFDLNNYIPSGVKQIDDLIIGFKRKHVTVWSGYRGCAKTTFLNMLILNGANMGYKSALWTGELDMDEEKTWLYLQASGKSYNKSTKNGFYYTPNHVSEKIDKWIDKYFWIFNNEYHNQFTQIIDKVRELKKKEDIDFIILDNLMTLDIDDLDGDKNEKQKKLMFTLTCLAKELNIHIHIVCHPNKSGTFLRPNNISGTGHIPDLAQNVFILHRIGRDFSANARDFLSSRTLEEIERSECTNCIEICKCRDKGSAVDEFIKLYFERESNRLKNDISEHIVYGWEEESEQSSIVPQADQPKKDDLPNPFDGGNNWDFPTCSSSSWGTSNPSLDDDDDLPW